MELADDSQENLGPLETLPLEILQAIAKNTKDENAIIKWCQTSKKFNELICTDPIFWFEFYKDEFVTNLAITDIDFDEDGTPEAKITRDHQRVTIHHLQDGYQQLFLQIVNEFPSNEIKNSIYYTHMLVAIKNGFTVIIRLLLNIYYQSGSFP